MNCRILIHLVGLVLFFNFGRAHHVNGSNSASYDFLHARSKRAASSSYFFVPPHEVQPTEKIIALEELTIANLHKYIGARDDDSFENMKKGFEFLASYSLIHNNVDCSKDGEKMSIIKDIDQKTSKMMWRCATCRKGKCTTKKSVRDDSFFEGLQLTVAQELYLAAEWIENPKKPIRQVAKEHGLDTDTVYQHYNMFRDMLQQWGERKAAQNNMKLGGRGKIVEIDETMVYRAKYNRGRMLTRSQVWVFGLIERNSNKVVMRIVPRRDAATLLPIIEDVVEPHTWIMSDGWAAYNGIAQLQQAYNHGVVNHNVNFVNPSDPRIHTQSIEATWGALKRDLKSYYGVPEHNMDGYLINYMWRRNYNKEKLLNRLIYEMMYYRREDGSLNKKTSSAPASTTTTALTTTTTPASTSASSPSTTTTSQRPTTTTALTTITTRTSPSTTTTTPTPSTTLTSTITTTTGTTRKNTKTTAITTTHPTTTTTQKTTPPTKPTKATRPTRTTTTTARPTTTTTRKTTPPTKPTKATRPTRTTTTTTPSPPRNTRKHPTRTTTPPPPPNGGRKGGHGGRSG